MHRMHEQLVPAEIASQTFQKEKAELLHTVSALGCCALKSSPF